jgi:hypothetical protein
VVVAQNVYADVSCLVLLQRPIKGQDVTLHGHQAVMPSTKQQEVLVSELCHNRSETEAFVVGEQPLI